MWKPPERIRHAPEPGAWPTRDQAEGSLWFSPIPIGPLTSDQPHLGAGDGALAFQ